MKRLWFYGFVMSVGFALQSLQAGCVPAGTAGDDIINCTGNSANLAALGGDDFVALNQATGHSVYYLDEALGGNPATDGNDTFVSDSSTFFWVFGFGGDDRFEITDSNFSNAYGDTNPGHGTSQRGNDTILIENSISNGYILGGNDNDTITIINSTVSNVAAGYSNIYPGVDYSPYDGNDTIVLDHVDFSAPLYWDPLSTEGVVTGGRGDDTITLRNGGEAYYVYGGHGSDTINIGGGEHFNPCLSSRQDPDRCGIYGDIGYANEPNATAIPFLHGDDIVRLSDVDFRNGYLQGGDGSDHVSVATQGRIIGAELDGGDDRRVADGFVDRLSLEHWSGDLNGSLLKNWEQIVVGQGSEITFVDVNLSTGIDPGTDSVTGLPYGLIIHNEAVWRQHTFFDLDGNLHNEGIIDLNDDTVTGTVLKVAGDYGGGGDAVIRLDTVLNGAAPSQTDQVHILGQTKGTTKLEVHNKGGAGAQTPTGDNQGILLIRVEGSSEGTFRLDTPLEAGNYLYHLTKGSNGNWYLQSEKKTPAFSVSVTVDSSIVTDPNQLHYRIELVNTGNVPITHPVLESTLPDGSKGQPVYVEGDTDNDGVLDVGEHWIFRESYNVSQAEIDRGTSLVFKVEATSDRSEVQSVSATAATPTPCWCDRMNTDRAGFNFLFLLILLPLLMWMIEMKESSLRK